MKPAVGTETVFEAETSAEECYLFFISPCALKRSMSESLLMIFLGEDVSAEFVEKLELRVWYNLV